MFETIYLTSAEKREFLNEFAQNIMAAMEEKQLKKEPKGIVKKEREEAFEKAKLITRQFPGFEPVVKPLIFEVAEGEIQTEPIRSKGEFLTLNEKIDNLLNDAAVKIIECSDSIIRISKGAGSEETGFKLSEEESKDVIKKFSEKTKIPFDTGLFKARVGNLAITAIVSDFIGNRFLIIKG